MAKSNNDDEKYDLKISQHKEQIIKAKDKLKNETAILSSTQKTIPLSMGIKESKLDKLTYEEVADILKNGTVQDSEMLIGFSGIDQAEHLDQIKNIIDKKSEEFQNLGYTYEESMMFINQGVIVTGKYKTKEEYDLILDEIENKNISNGYAGADGRIHTHVEIYDAYRTSGPVKNGNSTLECEDPLVLTAFLFD